MSTFTAHFRQATYSSSLTHKDTPRQSRIEAAFHSVFGMREQQWMLGRAVAGKREWKGRSRRAAETYEVPQAVSNGMVSGE